MENVVEIEKVKGKCIIVKGRFIRKKNFFIKLIDNN